MGHIQQLCNKLPDQNSNFTCAKNFDQSESEEDSEGWTSQVQTVTDRHVCGFQDYAIVTLCASRVYSSRVHSSVYQLPLCIYTSIAITRYRLLKHTLTYIYIYIHIQAYVNAYAYGYVYAYVYVYIYYVDVCVCTYKFVYIYIYIC